MESWRERGKEDPSSVLQNHNGFSEDKIKKVFCFLKPVKNDNGFMYLMLIYADFVFYGKVL